MYFYNLQRLQHEVHVFYFIYHKKGALGIQSSIFLW